MKGAEVERWMMSDAKHVMRQSWHIGKEIEVAGEEGRGKKPKESPRKSWNLSAAITQPYSASGSERENLMLRYRGGVWVCECECGWVRGGGR